jgi:hypothetical protein
MPHPAVALAKNCRPSLRIVIPSEARNLHRPFHQNIVIPSEARNLLLAAAAHPAAYASSRPNQTEGCPTLSASCALGWEPTLPKQLVAERKNYVIPAQQTTLSSQPKRSAVEEPSVLHNPLNQRTLPAKLSLSRIVIPEEVRDLHRPVHQNIVIPSEARNLLFADRPSCGVCFLSPQPNREVPHPSASCALGWEPTLPKRPAAVEK